MENVIGKCMEMCPEKEVVMRERNGLLHRLEMLKGTERAKQPKADRNRIVKCFARSAAGRSMPEPEDLRPTEVLLKTVEYLLTEVIRNTECGDIATYNYIFDRLRAVRQDVVIQCLDKPSTISLLQPIIRFHALYAYRLCQESVQDFDPTLNNKHLLECLKKLLVCYTECDRIKFLGHELELSLSDYDELFLTERPIFEALYLLHNLGDNEAILRGIDVPYLYRNWEFDMALQMSILYQKRNFVKVCRLMKELPTLLAAVAALHLPNLRKQALHIMSKAFNTKNLTFPMETLKKTLLYNDEKCLQSDLKRYNISFENHDIFFKLKDFDVNKKVSAPILENFVEEKFSQKNLDDIILHGLLD